MFLQWSFQNKIRNKSIIDYRISQIFIFYFGWENFLNLQKKLRHIAGIEYATLVEFFSWNFSMVYSKAHDIITNANHICLWDAFIPEEEFPKKSENSPPPLSYCITSSL